MPNDENVDPSTTNDEEVVEEAGNNADSSAETASDTTSTEPSIPFSRFQEVNEQSKEYKEQVEKLQAELEQARTSSSATTTEAKATDPNLEEARRQIEAMGFVPKEQLEQTLRQKEEDAKLEQELTRLEGVYDGKDGKPKFNRKDVIDFAVEKGIGDPEVAFKAMKEKEILDYQVKQAIAGSKGVKAEQSDGSGSTQSGTTDGDLKDAIADGDKSALRTYLKRVAKS